MSEEIPPDISRLIREVRTDLLQLAREYLTLLKVSLQDGAKKAKLGATLLVLAGAYSVVGLGMLSYGLVGVIFTSNEIVIEQVHISLAAGAFDLILAVLLAIGGLRVIGKSLDAPRSLIVSPSLNNSLRSTT